MRSGTPASIGSCGGSRRSAAGGSRSFAEIAGRILAHAGVGEQVSVVVGTLGDGGDTIAVLEEEHGFSEGSLDFVFVDHDKDAYLPDLERILERGWLRAGAVVVADNVKVLGVPGYREHMRAREGHEWHTTEHQTHLEYQTLIKDLMLESKYLGRSGETPGETGQPPRLGCTAEPDSEDRDDD